MASVLVADANVLIDLQVGGLLRVSMRLPDDLLTVDIIAAELTEGTKKAIRAVRVPEEGLSGELLEDVVRFGRRYRRPSRPDLAGLVLARERSGILLTGDAGLREAAEQEGIACHGTLWLLDRLVALEVIEAREAAKALHRMMAADRRLPRAEVRQRLRRWESSEPDN